MKINLNKNKSLKEIQNKLYKRFNIPVYFQTFQSIYGYRRNEEILNYFLENNFCFNNCNYQNLELKDTLKFEIIIENRYEYYLDVKYNDTIGIIRDKIEKKNTS